MSLPIESHETLHVAAVPVLCVRLWLFLTFYISASLFSFTFFLLFIFFFSFFSFLLIYFYVILERSSATHVYTAAATRDVGRVKTRTCQPNHAEEGPRSQEAEKQEDYGIREGIQNAKIKNKKKIYIQR